MYSFFDMNSDISDRIDINAFCCSCDSSCLAVRKKFFLEKKAARKKKMFCLYSISRKEFSSSETFFVGAIYT